MDLQTDESRLASSRLALEIAETSQKDSLVFEFDLSPSADDVIAYFPQTVQRLRRDQLLFTHRLRQQVNGLHVQEHFLFAIVQRGC